MLSAFLVGCGFVVATLVATFAAYYLMRWFTGGDPSTQTRDLASSVIFRVSALHGLILALVFAQEMIEFQQIKFDGATEANAVADVYYDSGRYSAEAKAEIQPPLAEYLRIVIGEEWSQLGSLGTLSPAAWAQWDTAYNSVLDLEPATKRQESLRDNMLAGIHTIALTRDKRENHGSDPLNGMFWLAAISGVLLIALGYFPFPPEQHNLLLISMFGAFTGIVLFFIYAFSNPYSPPGALTPAPFERLYEQLPR